jgi:hypothetical protein
MQLKYEGLTNKDIVIQLNALGYRNPKTLKPWSKGMLQYRLSGIKRNDEQEVKALIAVCTVLLLSPARVSSSDIVQGPCHDSQSTLSSIASKVSLVAGV